MDSRYVVYRSRARHDELIEELIRLGPFGLYICNERSPNGVPCIRRSLGNFSGSVETLGCILRRIG